VPSAAERHLLGTGDWLERTGSWEWGPAHTILDKRGLRRRVGQWHDISEWTDNEVVHTGWRPRHQMWPRGHWVGGRSGQARGGGSPEGSKVELSCDDWGGRRGSGEAVGGTSEGESSSGSRLHRRRGGTGMVSGSIDQCSQRHGKADQDLRQIEAVVDRWHRRREKSGRQRETEDDGIRRKPLGRRQSSRSQFSGPRAKLAVTTCRTWAEPRCGEQHNTPTLEPAWLWRP